MKSTTEAAADEKSTDDGFVLLTELGDGDPQLRVPLHPQHIRKMVKRGRFPSPVKIGGRIAFRRRDIREWSRKQA